MLSKKDFEKYIKSYNKKPGTYTDDEIYAIGLKHKELCKGDRDWDGLAKKLGINKSNNAFRCWIKSKQREDGTLPKDKTKLSERTIDDLTFSETEAKLTELKQDMFVQATKLRDQRNAYNRTLRDEARIQDLKDYIESAADKLKELPKVKCELKKTDGNNEAILMLSDLHIGVDCDNFYNKYNLDIARKRVAKVVDVTIKQCKRYGIKRLNVLNLGDLIHGNIHVSARVTQQESAIDQVMLASEIISDAISNLQKAAPEVVYRSVVDNHSRLTANKDEHIEKDNLNRLIDWYIERRLKDTSVKFPKDNLDVGLGSFNLMNGKLVVFSHGHEDRINTSFQDLTGALRKFVDYVIMGHLHNTKLKSFNGSKVFVNGSIVGTEEYALSKRLFSQPEQTLLIFDDTEVVDITIGLGDING